jgi:nicotinamide-nucleotide adenylyltransferase
MEYVLAAKALCSFLFVGITNPDPFLTAFDPSNPHRSELDSNPFTYFERQRMIEESMRDEGIPHSGFSVVPFPINFPERLRYYAPEGACYFVTIYDDWGRRKARLLQELGLRVQVLWERPMTTRLTSGSEIRSLMRREGDWSHLVPPGVSRTVQDLDIDIRRSL